MVLGEWGGRCDVNEVYNSKKILMVQKSEKILLPF